MEVLAERLPGTFQIRKKWFKDGQRMIVGDMVVIAEDNQPPLVWKLGRIIVIDGNDEVNRVFKVKTATGYLIRPVVKLRKLVLDNSVPNLTLLESNISSDT